MWNNNDYIGLYIHNPTHQLIIHVVPTFITIPQLKSRCMVIPIWYMSISFVVELDLLRFIGFKLKNHLPCSMTMYTSVWSLPTLYSNKKFQYKRLKVTTKEK